MPVVVFRPEGPKTTGHLLENQLRYKDGVFEHRCNDRLCADQAGNWIVLKLQFIANSSPYSQKSKERPCLCFKCAAYFNKHSTEQ